jgi:amino acid adenylation domain-containing protein
VTVTVDGMLRAAAERTPDALAVVDGDRSLTYTELDAAVTAAAADIERASRVVVVGPLTLELYVRILGILRAGAAFVPVDAGATPEWIDHIARDSGAVGAGDPDAGRVPSTPHGPDDVACVVYTSGSTSRPKGVVLPHRGVVNLADAAGDAMGLTAGDRFLQLAQIGFSASLEELFPPLRVGACLVIAGYPRAFTGTAAFCRFLGDHGITLFELTTALWHELTDDIARGEVQLPPSVRLVVVGGDKPSPARLRDWAAAATPTLLQVYGPTETTATATYGRLDPGRPGYEDGPIGRAILNTRCHVLDADLRPVTAGERGELYVAGAALAHGYEGRPAETAARFVPDPSPDAPPGSRMYRTGDVVHEGPGGDLSFDGRVDDQMKVRGVRIEPAAVEDAVAGHPAVRAVVAFAHNDQLGVAVVLRPGPAADAASVVTELRADLAARFPAYLCPDRYAVVDEIPLTDHNKIDRAALARLPVVGPAPAAAGWSPTEARLRAIWQDVLAVPVASPDDDFMALGGNSLLILRLISRLSRDLGVRLTHAEVRATETLRALARQVDEARTPAPASAPAGNGNGHGNGHASARFPALRSLEAFHFLAELEPESRAYNESWAFWVDAPLDLDALRAAFAAATRRRDVLRSSLRFEDGALWQHVADEVAVDVAEVPDDGTPLPARLREQATAAFDLGRAPLYRLRLHRVDGESSVLQFVGHHAMLDAWTCGLLVAEVDDLYQAAVGCGELTGPPAPQFRGYAEDLTRRLAGPTGDRLRDHWAEVLRGLPPGPLDRLAPAPVQRPASPGRQLRRTLPAVLAAAVDRRARVLRTTPFVVMLAAFYRFLAAETGLDDLHVVTPSANRDDADADLYGCTMNTLVLRCDLGDAPSADDLVRRVDRVVGAAVQHGQLPYADVVGIARRTALDPATTLVSNVGFGLEEQTTTPTTFGGHRRSPNTYVHTGHSKAALGWRVWHHPDRIEVTVDWRHDTGFDLASVDALVDRYEAALGADHRVPATTARAS